MSNEVKCPKCGSNEITAQKHGFSAGKAVVGAALTGRVGLLAGLHGSSDIDILCLACGKKWNPKKLADEKKQTSIQKNSSDFKKWKKAFYTAYEAGKLEDAKQIYLLKSTFSGHSKDINSAYKLQKKNDRQMNGFLVIAFVILIIVVVLISIWIN